VTAFYCPDCYEPVPVRRSAKEGRCDQCRPSRRHSEPRKPNASERWARLMSEHGSAS
jgi:hypothetical protein